MCSLKVKFRIVGKKNQEFMRFILVPKNIRQKGKIFLTLGYWDTRKNSQIKYVVFNIYLFMFYYRFGTTPNKTTLLQIFFYFAKSKSLENWLYFKDIEVRLLVENELKKKFYLKKFII